MIPSSVRLDSYAFLFLCCSFFLNFLATEQQKENNNNISEIQY